MQTPETTTATGTTELATSVIGTILTPADFNALDDLISKLGDSNKNLTDEEKKMAVSVIDQWNTSVASRIKENAEMARNVIDLLSGKAVYWGTASDIIEMLNDFVGETPEYQAFQDAEAAYSCAVAEMNNANGEPVITDDMTVAEVDDARMAKQREQMIAQRNVNRAHAELANASTAYVKALNKDPRIKQALEQLKAYKRKASRMANVCDEKAAKAKINISIANENVRKLLHEMMDFAKTV